MRKEEEIKINNLLGGNLQSNISMNSRIASNISNNK
jgi:hypothetical protein